MWPNLWLIATAIFLAFFIFASIFYAPNIRTALFGIRYEAPLIDKGTPEWIVPDEYFVYLRPGHSLQNHSAVIGRDINPHVRRVLSSLYPDRVVYITNRIDAALLAAIRADTKVEKLYHEYLAIVGDGASPDSSNESDE
jgi:hypothetical protein